MAECRCQASSKAKPWKPNSNCQAQEARASRNMFAVFCFLSFGRSLGTSFHQIHAFFSSMIDEYDIIELFGPVHRGMASVSLISRVVSRSTDQLGTIIIIRLIILIVHSCLRSCLQIIAFQFDDRLECLVLVCCLVKHRIERDLGYLVQSAPRAHLQYVTVLRFE